MADSAHIVEANEQNFQQTILESSMQQPVLVDFWADWCGPCKSLMPILEKLADEYDGAFKLAKVNSDENQQLAAQAGVRSLPTVMLFDQGRPVDMFNGALPEGEVRAFLEKHDIHSAVDQRLPQAEMLLQSGDTDGAIELLNQLVAEDGQNGDALLLLARAAVQKGENDSATSLLEQLPDEHARKPEAAQIKGMIHFTREVDASRDFAELAAAVAAGDADSETRYQHALQLCLQGQFEPALEALLKLMLDDREYGDDAARKLLINIFDVLGSDPLVNQYRRRMFALLH